MKLDFAEAVKHGLENNGRILKKKEKIDSLKRKLSKLKEEKDWEFETSIEGRAVSDNKRTTSRKKMASITGERTFNQGLTLKPEIYLKEKDLLENGLTTDSINYNLELAQPLYPWGLAKDKSEHKTIELKIAETKAELKDLERKLLIDSLEDYLELIELKLEKKIKMEEHNLAKQFLEKEELKYQQGKLTREEVLDAKIDLNEAKQDLEEIKNKYFKVSSNLKQDLGLKSKSEINVLITKEFDLEKLLGVESKLPNLDDQVSLLAEAKANSKELLIQELEKNQLKEEQKQQKIDESPELDLNADYDAVDKEWEVALNVTHKLFNDDQNELAREKLKEELEKLERDTNQYLAELKVDINDLVGQITVDELKVREEELRLEKAVLELEELKPEQTKDELVSVEYQNEQLDLRKTELKLRKKKHKLLLSKYQLIKLLEG